jgi:psiF repeat
MLGRLCLAGLVPLLMLATPANAATKQQKMETCKFGADDQKLTGAKRNAFMSKCMSNRDDKRGPAPATAGAKPAAKPAPASDEAPADDND